MSWIWYIIAALWILDALRMRARWARIPAMSPSDEPASDAYDFMTTPGVDLDENTRRAASAFAKANHLDLLDIIPGDVPALIAVGTAQAVDPALYRGNRVARGRTAGYAMLASKELLARAAIEYQGVYDAVSFIRLAARLKRYALERADLAIAPSLAASAGNHLDDWLVFSSAIGGMANSMFMLRGIMMLLILTGLFATPIAGVASVAAFHLQVLIVLGGTKVRPRDFWPVFLFRLPIECWTLVKLSISRLSTKDTAAAERLAAMRQRYERLTANGTAHFYQPRREDCPLCGSHDLRVRIRTTDLVQSKPGRFYLEECKACGHIFQNPRLTPAGLDFYYSDFYDGIGTGFAEALFSGRPGLYRERARSVEQFGTPRRWLDVGTGQAHFCCAAKSSWPETQFDGLDIGEGVDEALKAGWIDRGFRGFLPEVAPQIAGSYDVVSLFHCLEHTPDPRAELEAAFTALAPGGLLVIEVPDPECVLGRVFGRFWLPWFQPQHLHLLSIKNLTKLLREYGFEPLVTHRKEAHIRIDMFSFAMMFYGWLGPKIDVPGSPPHPGSPGCAILPYGG